MLCIFAPTPMCLDWSSDVETVSWRLQLHEISTKKKIGRLKVLGYSYATPWGVLGSRICQHVPLWCWFFLYRVGASQEPFEPASTAFGAHTHDLSVTLLAGFRLYMEYQGPKWIRSAFVFSGLKSPHSFCSLRVGFRDVPNTVSNDVPTFDLVNLKPIFQTYSKTLKTENCRCNGSI